MEVSRPIDRCDIHQGDQIVARVDELGQADGLVKLVRVERAFTLARRPIDQAAGTSI